ncbi:hypothetical protein [Streptomyces tauricus]
MRNILRGKSSSTALLVIDRQERILLSRAHGESSWRPIKSRVIRLWPSKFSLLHVLDPLFSHWFLAATPVIGKFDPLPEQGGQSGLTHIFVVRHSRMRPISLHARTHPFTSSDQAWHPLPEVEDGDLDVCPRELGPFTRGYLEGWIPDGVITLVE